MTCSGQMLRSTLVALAAAVVAAKAAFDKLGAVERKRRNERPPAFRLGEPRIFRSRPGRDWEQREKPKHRRGR